MSPKFPWKRICVLILTVLCGQDGTQGSLTMQCEDLKCFNNSPCRVVSDGQGSRGECVCQHGWTGSSCQTQISLKVTSVSMATVRLKVEQLEQEDTDSSKDVLNGSESLNITKLPIDLNGSNTTYQNTHSHFSIHYWKGNNSNLCNIVSMETTSDITIIGLQNNSDYTFCVVKEGTILCNLDLFYHHVNASYCTTARTSALPVTMDTNSVSAETFYTVIVSCTVIVALVILIAVLVMSVRNRYFTHLIGAKKRKRHYSHQRTDSPTDDSITQETLLLTMPTTNQRIVVNPPSSPGKPKNQLVNNKKRGYASFTAKNDQTIALSTVIEYGEEDTQSIDSFYDNQEDYQQQQQVTFLVHNGQES